MASHDLRDHVRFHAGEGDAEQYGQRGIDRALGCGASTIGPYRSALGDHGDDLPHCYTLLENPG